MPIQPQPVHLDPDFRSTLRADGFRPPLDADRYRRFLYNGYPAALIAVVFVTLAVRFDIDSDLSVFLFPPVAMILLAIVRYFPRAFRYHCLDCGAGGRLADRGRHICPEVARRITTASPVRHGLPGVAVQLFLEVLVLGALLPVVLRLAD